MNALRILVYLVLVTALTLVSDPRVYATVLAATLLAAGRGAPLLAKRVLAAVAIFGGAVSLAWTASSLWRGESPWSWLLLTGLRVGAMTALTLHAASRIDPVRATARWPSLQFAVLLALAQIRMLEHMGRDARLALRSRALRRPGPGTVLRHGGAVGGAVVRRAQHDLEARLRAMDARGFFADADRG